jgi:DNA-binding transcriptional LysR family regulator
MFGQVRAANHGHLRCAARGFRDRGGDVELRSLQYFVTVAEELHFARAAERLHIAQPAVSQQIARLERELGARLLDRSPRHVWLTPSGVRVLEAARETLAAAARVRVVAGEPAARLRIGVASGITARLERGVALLRGADRPVEPVLVDLPTPQRLDAVRNGELDLALVRGPVTTAGVRVARSWSEPLWVVVSDRHPAAGRPAAVLAELDPTGLRLPSRDADPPLHDAITSALRLAGKGPAAGRSVGNVLDVLIEIGADERAWTLLPAEQLAGLASRRVHAIPPAAAPDDAGPDDEGPDDAGPDVAGPDVAGPDVAALRVDGHVVASLTTPDACVASFVAAFADDVSAGFRGAGARP